MYRERELVEQISVCDGQAVYDDESAVTLSDAKAVGLHDCPYLDECFSGQLQRAGLKCAAALGQVMARSVVINRTRVEREVDELKRARVLPPHSSGVIDPRNNDVSQVEKDPDAALELVTDWAYRIMGAPKPPSVASHGNQEQAEIKKEETPFERLVRLDRTEVVYPDGKATRVSRDACRCPIVRVGDFCPVHGG